jgi:hypothetical protein
MPSIKDMDKLNKNFKKKEYRPWSKKENETSSVSLKDNKSQLNNDTKEDELEKIWRYLYGSKKIILEYLIQNINETKNEYVVTSPITTNQLNVDSSLPENTIKASIQQLKGSSLISNYETKPGKGGFARYKISIEIYKFLVEKFSSK